MSALDLTASAVSRLTDVAESAMTDEGCRTERSSETRYLARTAVLALAPLIERQVREQVAREIRAAWVAWTERPEVQDAIDDALMREPRSELTTEQRIFGAGYGTAINDAAYIARGGAR